MNKNKYSRKEIKADKRTTLKYMTITGMLASTKSSRMAQDAQKVIE